MAAAVFAVINLVCAVWWLAGGPSANFVYSISLMLFFAGVGFVSRMMPTPTAEGERPPDPQA